MVYSFCEQRNACFLIYLLGSDFLLINIGLIATSHAVA